MPETIIERRSADEVINTNGGGAWTNKQKPVRITLLELIRDKKSYGELRVHFDLATWNTEEDGLIYCDPCFILELRGYLKRAGYNPFNVEYSTSGWQGDNFVSLDVSQAFIRSWSK